MALAVFTGSGVLASAPQLVESAKKAHRHRHRRRKGQGLGGTPLGRGFQCVAVIGSSRGEENQPRVGAILSQEATLTRSSLEATTNPIGESI